MTNRRLSGRPMELTASAEASRAKWGNSVWPTGHWHCAAAVAGLGAEMVGWAWLNRAIGGMVAGQGDCRGAYRCRHKASAQRGGGGAEEASLLLPAIPQPTTACSHNAATCMVALQAGCLTASGYQAIQVACRRCAAQGCKRTQRAGQARLVGCASDIGWRAAITRRGAAAVIPGGTRVAVAAGVPKVAQQHICTSQASGSSHSGVLLSDFGTRATRANRFQKRLGQHG